MVGLLEKVKVKFENIEITDTVSYIMKVCLNMIMQILPVQEDKQLLQNLLTRTQTSNIQFPQLTLQQLYEVYDITGESIFLLYNDQIDLYRENLKDYVLGCYKYISPNETQTWKKKIINEGMIQLNSIQPIQNSIIPSLTKKYLEMLDIIHPEKSAQFEVIKNKKTRSSQRIRMIGLLTSQLSEPFASSNLLNTTPKTQYVNLYDNLIHLLQPAQSEKETLQILDKELKTLLLSVIKTFSTDNTYVDIHFWVWYNFRKLKKRVQDIYQKKRAEIKGDVIGWDNKQVITSDLFQKSFVVEMLINQV